NSNDEFGKITLSSAFGENVEAELIKTSITLDNNSLNHPMDCLVAITDKLNAEALIPPSFYEALCSINNETNENDIFTESVDSFTPFSNDENDAESVNEIFYVESDSDNLNLNSDYSKMKDEQNNCDSLKMVRAELKLNKGNFLLVEELIYHRDKILNEPVMQLVLPRCRIEKVMKLAHELLYGREARGPLAILKSSWAGEIHLPTNISQSAADYLQEMKIKMEKAAESASLTAAQKQKSYGDYFNKRSSVKNFSIGEQVVLLIPDSSNKIYARWTGPGEIIQHHPPHSYKVKLPDGTIRHVHVNKIRNYHPRALASGVIFEDDHEFGEIHPTPNLSRSTSERVLHETDLNHLKETEREQVLAILLKHRTLFTSDVKIAKVGAHRIRLKPNIERKKPFLYRILESLKIKVDEQIEELLRLDLIEESDAEIAYPIVCVNKKDGNSNDEFEKITLSSAFGENVEAELIKTSITLDNNSLNHPMDCLVAITDKLNAEALIPPSFYEALCSINNETNENDIFTESVDSFTPFSNDENDAESVNEIFYVESDSDNLNLNSDYSKMKDEQNNCDSLKMIRAELKLNKGNFLLVEELIYHRDKILNEPVMQLVLPRCRIEKVMKLAHELLYGREARGPLAILKSSWAGEIHLPTNISQSAADYLQEMKIKMEKAAESASLTAAQKQKVMEIISTRGHP
ncbi:retrovirus-related Pol polyprotein from transposon 17.6, partial [Trichonephila clavata]